MIRSRSVRWVAFLLGCAAVLAPAASAQAAPLMLGAATDLTWGISRAEMDRTIAALRSAGVRSIRLNASWTGTEPNAKGTLNRRYVADLDYAVDAALAARLDVLMQVGDSVPFWASADPARRRGPDGPRWNRAYRPRDARDYAGFARFLAERYAPRGVRNFELWNEPNHPRFWPSGREPGRYVELLAAGSRAILAAAPRSRIVLGGLSGNDGRYLEDLYAAGATRHFDVVAVHPYTGGLSPGRCWREPGAALAVHAFCGLEEIRATMVANGDARKQVWITEFGWTTYDGSYGVSDAEQARYLRDAVRRLRAHRWVGRAYWYSFRNTWFRRERRADPEAHYGLLHVDFGRKPAYYAFRRAARAAR